MKASDFLIKAVGSTKILVDRKANLIKEYPNGERVLISQDEGGAVTSVNGMTGEVTITIPTKVSELQNDVPYATKAELSAIPKFQIKVVSFLPPEGEKATVYLVTQNDPKTQDLYAEYIWVNKAWELLGRTVVDMSQYVTKSDLPNNVVGANKNTKIWTGSQSEYNAITTKDLETLYFVTE